MGEYLVLDGAWGLFMGATLNYAQGSLTGVQGAKHEAGDKPRSANARQVASPLYYIQAQWVPFGSHLLQ